MFVQDFDGHRTIQVGIPGFIYPCHAAHANPFADFIPAYAFVDERISDGGHASFSGR
jgi:hypothetical protein